MATISVTHENFQDTVAQDGILILDWWAPWCGPCRGFAPVFERASDAHPDIRFGKINTEEQQELAGSFEIQAIPTLMVFRDRVLVFSQAGALPAPMLESLIQQVKALDMDQVRAEIAAEEQREAAQGDGKPPLIHQS